MTASVLQESGIAASVLDAALELHAAGLCVLPAAEDGSKRPAVDWKAFQRTRPDADQLHAWFGDGNRSGLGVVCGSVSDGLELLELEGRAVAAGALATLVEVSREAGLAHVWSRVGSGYVVASPSGGLHFLYRIAEVPVPGNTKLAALADNTTLAETRGEGGWVVTAPSCGSVHPTGGAWQVLAGRPATIPTITAEEREELHRLVRLLDERAMPEPPATSPFQQPRRGSGSGVSPGDHWSAQTDWPEILEPEGWRRVFTKGGVTYWRRPGKAHGVSATTGFGAGEWFYPFTSSTAFEPERTYTKFAALAVLRHGGDYQATAKALQAAGFGTRAERPAETETGSATSAGASAAAVTLDVVTASQVELRRVAYLWEHRIPLGAVTLMPGEEGIGKTTVGVRIMADLTRGRLAGESLGTSRDVLVVATEDGLGDVFVPRLHEAGADLDRVHIVRARVTLDGERGEVILPRDLPHLARVVAEHDVALVWIDSLVTTLPDELKSIAYKDTAKVLKALGSWAEEQRVAVAAPWHLNKAAGSDTAVRIMDSRAFRTAVRSMLLVVADPDAPEGVTQGVVALDKANAGTLNVSALRYRIRSAPYVVAELDPVTGELRELPSSCGVADWIGEVDGDGRQFARAALAPRLEKDGSPKEWLREYLTAVGEMVRGQVLADAAGERGFSEATIKRAARSLGVHSREVTGRDDRGVPFRRAIWSLPQSVHTRTTDPTEPTGEGSPDPIDPISAGQAKLAQSGRSDLCGLDREDGDPTGLAGLPAPTFAQMTDPLYLPGTSYVPPAAEVR